MRWTRLSSLFVLLLLTGCAHNFPAPEDTEGGYLAFPMEVIDETKTPFIFVHSFKVFDTETNEHVDTFQLDPANGAYVRSFGPLPAGDYYLGVKTTYARQSSTTRVQFKPSPQNIRLAFRIHEDTITVLNRQLWVYKRAQATGRGNVTSDRITALTPDIREKALAQLAKQDESRNWIIEIGN